ncbi:MAG: response regulator transcription factor [Candidatus Eremiobacterota bacterium]
MRQILLVEDDREVREVVARYLQDHGFGVCTAGDGPEALKQVDRADLVVLDLGLPTLDGLEVLRRIRASNPIPILILSARGEGADRVTGLELGADDYLTKPFLPRELVARVKALLRRVPAAAPVPAGGALVIDTEARRVTLEGEPVELTPTEYELIRVLSGAPGKTFSREELLDRVWGDEYVGETRRVDLQVSRLRAKLTRPGRPAPIRSVWGVGYRFED